MNVYVTAHNTNYRGHYRELVGHARAEFPEARIRVLFGQEPPAAGGEADHERFLLPRGFTKQVNSRIDPDAIRRRLACFAGRVPLDLHRSDLRLSVRTRTEGMLALEQAALAEAIEAEFNETIPDLVFVSSGTNLLHSIGYYLAAARDAKTYRIHGYLNLDLDRRHQRVWFCSNNHMSLSERPEDSFGYEREAVSAHITSLHEAIRTRRFKRDVNSRPLRRRRMPVSLLQFAEDVGRIAYFASPLHRRGKIGRLSSGVNRDRLRVLVNSHRNRRSMLPVERLPKHYVLFALNTPYDSQILIRAPEYRDLLSLIELVAGMMPYGYDLALREHPAFPGMLDHARLVALQKRHPHVKLVSSDAPFPHVMAGARGVLVINNTAFIDSILAGKPSISLANGHFFAGTGLTREVAHLRELRVALGELVNGALDVDHGPRLIHVMGRLLQETFPGPDGPHHEKIRAICDGILAKLRRIEAVYGSLEGFRGMLRPCGRAGSTP